jgi:LAS superfamily LD-carboxypeptidase LdcB
MAKEMKQKQNLSLFLVAFSAARYHKKNTPPVLRVGLAGEIRPRRIQTNLGENKQSVMIDKYIGQQRKWDQQKKDEEALRIKKAQEVEQKKQQRKQKSEKIVKEFATIPNGALLSTLLSALIFLIAVIVYVMYAKNITSFIFPSQTTSSKTSTVQTTGSVQGTQANNVSSSSSETSSSQSTSNTSSISNSTSSSISTISTSKNVVKVEDIPLNTFNQDVKDNIVNITLAEVSTNPIQIVVDKVRELPSNYLPTDLVNLNVLGGGKLKQEPAKLLEQMFADAKSKGIDLKVLSAFRSYDEQVSLYNSYIEAELKAGAKDRDAAAAEAKAKKSV